MTENEIIQILKDNKRNGIAFGFLPDEVIQFALKHKENLKFHDSEGFWIDTECQHKEGYDISIHEIVCLPEDYELKKIEKTGEWIEFEIDENGCYKILYTDMRFHWSEWNKPLWVYEKDENRSWYLTAFGGWQYKNCDAWYMYPMILLGDDRYVTCVFKGEVSDVKPAIPVKIRFWRISK